MALTKCRLGDYIELRGETNTDLVFGPADVRGVNNLKLLMQTKADINGRDLTKFQIVYPGEFVFNHRTGASSVLHIMMVISPLFAQRTMLYFAFVKSQGCVSLRNGCICFSTVQSLTDM